MTAFTIFVAFMQATSEVLDESCRYLKNKYSLAPRARV